MTDLENEKESKGPPSQRFSCFTLNSLVPEIPNGQMLRAVHIELVEEQVPVEKSGTDNETEWTGLNARVTCDMLLTPVTSNSSVIFPPTLPSVPLLRASLF